MREQRQTHQISSIPQLPIHVALVRVFLGKPWVNQPASTIHPHLLKNKVSRHPDWPGTYCVTEEDLELLILLSPPKCWGYKYVQSQGSENLIACKTNTIYGAISRPRLPFCLFSWLSSSTLTHRLYNAHSRRCIKYRQ